MRLEPGARVERGFFGWFEPDHPAATSAADLAFVDRALALPEAAPVREEATTATFVPPPATLFSAGPRLACRDLAEREVTRSLRRRAAATSSGRAAQLHSFFTGANRARGARGEGTRGAAAARADPAHRRRARSRRGVAHLDRVDERRLPLDGHAGPRQHQSFPVDDAQLPRPLPFARPAHLRRGRGWMAAARRALRVRDGSERLPLDLPARGRTDRGAQPGGGLAATSCRSRSRSWTARRVASWCRATSRSGATTVRTRLRCASAQRRAGRRARRSARQRRRPALSARLLPHRSRARHGHRSAGRRRAALRRRPQSRISPSSCS